MVWKTSPQKSLFITMDHKTRMMFSACWWPLNLVENYDITKSKIIPCLAIILQLSNLVKKRNNTTIDATRRWNI